MKNIYYDPSEFGLTQVDCLEEDLSYEFNILLFLQHNESKRIFFAQDSGCSCPTPFEDYRFESPDKNNLEEVKKENFEYFERQIESFPINMEERQSCISKLKNLLRAEYLVKINNKTNRER